jgi:hypothetical protein
MLERVQPLSMVPEPTLRDLHARVNEILDQGIPGDLVECGVWRGGAAFLMAEILERRGETDRKVWLFDSFEGLPAPREIDGHRAHEYAEKKDDPGYYDNCRADVEDVRASARRLGLEDLTEIVPGWFDDTLPEHSERIGPIAVLRIDCDWHDPVALCLETLYDQVSPGGIVIIDDYYTYEGCAIAVHEFLARRSLPHAIHQALWVAWFRKG